MPAGGIVFIVLEGLVLFLPGAPPRASDSAHRVAESLESARPEILAGLFLAGLALIAWIAFIGSVRAWLTGQEAAPELATAASGAALLALSLQLLGLLLFYGAAFQVAAHHEDAVVRGLTDGGNAAIELSKFGFAAFLGAVCLAARRRLPPLLYTGGLAAAGVLVVTAVPLLGGDRLTEFGGPVDLLGALPGFLWIAAFSVFLVGQARPVR